MERSAEVRKRPVSTAFVSSRTEELALERRAAYEAITVSGLIPITFDAFLSRLRDADVPQPSVEHELRVSRDRIVRDQVDVLLSQADLFIGIYCETVGTPRRVCGEQPWICYELYRFLVRWVVTTEHEERRSILPRDALSEDSRRQLERAGGDVDLEAAAWMRADGHRLIPALLRDAMLGQGDPSLVETVTAIARERVRLYDRAHHRRQPELEDFLAPFQNHCVRRFESISIPFELSEGEERYIPAHAMLFTHMRERLGNALSTGRLQRATVPEAREGVRFHLAESAASLHRPGVLYLLLRCCFQSGLSLEVLRVGSTRSRHELQGWAVPYRTQGSIDPSVLYFRRALCRTIRHLDPECPAHQDPIACVDVDVPCLVRVDRSPVPSDSDSKALRAAQRRESQWEWGYRFRFVDVPGTLWNLVSLITSYRGNITYLTYDAFFDRREEHEKVGFDRGNRVVEFEIGIASDADRGFGIERAAFEYQVKCLHGYISSNRLQKS